MHRLILAPLLALLLSAVVIADTLVLRNGTRIQGEVVAVRNGVIEFEERRGSGRGRLIQVERDEVLRIEFDNRGAGPQFGGGAGRPNGMRERQVVVSADVAWNDTGVDLRAGQTVFFQATGEVRWGRDRRDGPDGEDDSPTNPNRPLPNRPAAALIGKVGNTSRDVFFIGSDAGAIRVRSSGRLYLGVNDDFLGDNGGNFRVVVSY
jgi:hypothetical protein